MERLVEDAVLAGGIDTDCSHPRGDCKEKMFIEKLQTLDETHTDRFGYLRIIIYHFCIENNYRCKQTSSGAFLGSKYSFAPILQTNNISYNKKKLSLHVIGEFTSTENVFRLEKAGTKPNSKNVI